MYIIYNRRKDAVQFCSASWIDGGLCGVSYVVLQDGTSCLLIAAKYGHLEIVKFLVRVGGRALAMLANQHGMTCLSVAAVPENAECLEVVRYLVGAWGRELMALTPTSCTTCTNGDAARVLINSEIEAGEAKVGDGVFLRFFGLVVRRLTAGFFVCALCVWHCVQLLALCMGSHQRLGEESVIRKLVLPELLGVVGDAF